MPFTPRMGGRVGTTGPQKWFFLREPKSMQDENNSRVKSPHGDKHETVCPIVKSVILARRAQGAATTTGMIPLQQELAGN